MNIINSNINNLSEINTKNLSANYLCIECGQKYSLNKIIYRCESCNGLLDIEHNIDELKKTKTIEWKALLKNRSSSFAHPNSSGIWSKKEWVLPQISNEDIVTLGEGFTPLINLKKWAEKLNLENIWLKQCGTSHSGSFKDLGMTVLVSHVKSLLSKDIKIKAIACASTGDTSAALASYAAYCDIPCIVFLPEGKVSTAQLVQPIAAGAIVLSLKTDFDGCMKLIQELIKKENIYLANSLNSLRIEGQKTMGIEVIEQLNWEVPDWFIIPGGNLGNVSALVKGFNLIKELGFINKLPRVCVAQSAKANPLYLSYQNNFKELKAIKAQSTLASAIQIGDPVSYPRAVRALNMVEGVVEQASEEELANACAEVDRYGMFNDPHTGVALACLLKLVDKKVIKKNENVVVVSTAHGLKFSDIKTAYHNEKLGFKSEFVNKTHILEPNLDEIQNTLSKII